MAITRAQPSVSIRTLTDNPAAEGNLLRFEIERSEVAGDVLEVWVGMDELDVIDGQGHGDILPDAIENTSPLREIEPNQITAVFTVETADDIVWEKTFQDRDEDQARGLVQHRCCCRNSHYSCA